MSEQINTSNDVACTFQNCLEKTIGKCRECHLDYCLEHASEVDPANYCVNCLLPNDAEYKEGPLVDENGVQHKGRVIHPTGRAYRLSSKMVFEMSDEELKDFLEHERKVVQDIEHIREYHLITLGMSEAEVYRRDIAAAKREGQTLKFGYERQFVPAVNIPQKHERTSKTRTTKADKIVEMLCQLGLSAQDLVNLLKTTPSKKGK